MTFAATDDDALFQELSPHVALALEAAQLAYFAWDIRRDRLERPTSPVPELPASDRLRRSPCDLASLLAAIHPDDREAFESTLHEAVASHASTYRNVYRLKKGDGAVRWIEARGRVMFDADDKPARLVGIARDITDQKLDAQRRTLLLDIAQLVLEAKKVDGASSVQVFEALRDCLAADVLFNYAVEGTFLRLVASAGVPRELLQSARQLELGQAFCGLAAATRQPVVADAARIATDPAGVFVRAMGVRAYACHPLLDRTGSVLGTYSVASRTRDGFELSEVQFMQTVCHLLAMAWERQAADDASRHVTDRYKALVEATTHVVWTNSPQGEMLGPQPAWSAYTGQEEDEVQGYGWTKAIHPDDVQRTVDAWQYAVATRTPFAVEHRVRRRDGVFRWFSVSAVPVVKPSGTVREWVGLHRDIDEKKRNELELERAMADVNRARQAAESANRSKDEFLAMLGHELRNPLAPIVTGVHLLKRRGLELRELDVIERQAQHLTRMVDDLLDVSRIARGKIELRREPVEIREVVTAALETVAPAIEKGAHALTVDVPEGGLKVVADRGRMAQVVANLLTNAAKYTPRGGRIGLSAAREGHDVVVSVTDTGVGIDAELLPHVFDLFVQGRQTLARSQGGLGLGLAIVKNLVLSHGGWVEARSEGAGKGSQFRVRLPALPDAPQAPEAPRP